MNPIEHDLRPSRVSELLLFHALLGRGYISPFPATRGMVFTSALPGQALINFAHAEVQFRAYHESVTASDRQTLALAETQPEHMREATGMGKTKLKEMKEKLSKRAHIAWKDDQTLKPTLVELLKTHYYGSFTYLDAVGARLAASMSNPAKLASDLGWTTLMEGTTDETFIRAGATGGALIHSLTGVCPIFNFFCRCQESHLDKLLLKVKTTTQGQVGIGTTIAIRGTPGPYCGTTVQQLYSLARRVFTLGERSEDHRVKVRFSAGSYASWQQFLAWGLTEILEHDSPPAWQRKLAQTAPISPSNAILFGARAALVHAFIELTSVNPDGPIKELELTQQHLDAAIGMARFLYCQASGQEGFEKRNQNLRPGGEVLATPQLLRVAAVALEEAIEGAPPRRISRNQARRDIPGVTLGLLDELVKVGDMVELCGTEECQMGKTTRAYTLPKYAPPGDPDDALDEYEEAKADFVAHPDVFSEADALASVVRIRERAAQIFAEHFVPAVSLSRMAKRDRRILPKVLSMFPDSFVLRGGAVGIPEPESLASDEDAPLDAAGINVWVRHKPDGTDFCDWQAAHRLQLGDRWKREGNAPMRVPL